MRKVVVASSQAVYNEGAYRCPEHGRFYGTTRPIAQLERGDFGCPLPDLRRGRRRRSRPTRRRRPAARTSTPSRKLVQERLVISWGRATGIPAVALRYSCTYGPRQSLFNPYTGVIAIFCTRLANDLPPVVYEDGRQSRDLIFVEDVARANLLVADDRARRWPGLQRRHRAGGGDRRSGAAAGGAARQADRAAAPRRVPPGRDAGADLRRLRASAALGFAPRVEPGRRGSTATSTGCARRGRSRSTSPRAERMLRRRQVVKQAAAR